MKIITGNAELRQCIPNTFATVEGEVTWFEKLYAHLDTAEQWLAMNIASSEVIDSLYQQSETEPLKRLAAKIITCHALMVAIPSLDLVLTPNGFGIVNTGNVSPASKDRVERLITSVEKERDLSINEMVKRLGLREAWLATDQGKHFGKTLFPNLDLCSKMGIRDHLFDNYQSLQGQLIPIEDTLAETYFSQEQMSSFRHVALSGQVVNHTVARVIHAIRGVELLLLADKPVSQQNYFDIVDTIKNNPLVFPEWHASSTSKLFSPQVFKNEKECTGYWF